MPPRARGPREARILYNDIEYAGSGNTQCQQLAVVEKRRRTRQQPATLERSPVDAFQRVLARGDPCGPAASGKQHLRDEVHGFTTVPRTNVFG
jgi:hypothetical protein